MRANAPTIRLMLNIPPPSLSTPKSSTRSEPDFDKFAEQVSGLGFTLAFQSSQQLPGLSLTILRTASVIRSIERSAGTEWQGSATPLTLEMTMSNKRRYSRHYNTSHKQTGYTSHGHSSGAACFPAGTTIRTPTGPRDIASARPSDVVFAFDPGRNVLRTRRILKVCKYDRQGLWKLDFADGTELRTTGHHSFRVLDTWKKAQDIVTGDTLCCINAAGNVETRRVIRSIPMPEAEVVYNLIVEGEFSFVADGVIAHSFTHLRRLRMFVWTIARAIAGVARRERFMKVAVAVTDEKATTATSYQF